MSRRNGSKSQRQNLFICNPPRRFRPGASSAQRRPRSRMPFSLFPLVATRKHEPVPDAGTEDGYTPGHDAFPPVCLLRSTFAFGHPNGNLPFQPQLQETKPGAPWAVRVNNEQCPSLLAPTSWPDTRPHACYEVQSPGCMAQHDMAWHACAGEGLANAHWRIPRFVPCTKHFVPLQSRDKASCIASQPD